MEGGFFPRKKPHGCMVSINIGIENALIHVAFSGFFGEGVLGA
jgi:hypothetical protein